MCDYYQILGVEPSADLNTIKRAYWKRAMECHPDRGGSHENMLQINEAFQILSNPAARSHYDAIRANAANEQARKTSEDDVRQARQRAKDYPQTWSVFEKWFNAISQDIANAEYGKWHMSGPHTIPTAGKSISGWAFIIGGAILGFICSVCFFSAAPDSNAGAMGIAFIGGGGWLGKKIHELLRKNIRGAGPVPEDPSSSVVLDSPTVSCPQCSQRLRIPQTLNKLHLRCRTCGHEFVHSR